MSVSWTRMGNSVGKPSSNDRTGLPGRQDDRGKWALEETYNGRFQVDIEKKGRPSKWVTLNALRVLKRYYG